MRIKSTMLVWLWCVLTVLARTCSGAAPGATVNVFSNPGFESTDYSGNWNCKGGCTLTPSADAHTGQYSVKVSNRAERWQGLSQDVNLIAGAIYRVQAFVKLLTLAPENDKYQEFIMILTCENQSNKKKYERIGLTPHVVVGVWRQLGGAIRVGEGYHTCQVYIQTAHPAEYLVDDASALYLPDNPNWRTDAESTIETLRKTPIDLRLKAPKNGDPVTVELTQTKLAFPVGSVVGATHIVDSAYERYQQVFYENFEWGLIGNKLKWRLMEWTQLHQTQMSFPMGTAVGASQIVDPALTAYQDTFYSNFNWVVLENKLKWRLMEWTQGNIDYDTSWIAMNALREHGIKCRCHCTFWAKDKNNADWVKALYGNDLLAAIDTRIEGVIGNTTGRCEHWDVNNENLHGDFFERQTGVLNITMDMFQKIHDKDPYPELYLNDFGVVSGADMAVALQDVALQYQAAGVPLHGIGIQSHLKHFDLHLIKARLDIVAEAGLPIMITEFSLNDKNETNKAINLDRILTMMFAHPAVKGIILWGFWEGKIWEPDAVLYTGPNVTANEAGLAYENLFHNEWRTNHTDTFTGKKKYILPSFKGSYTVTVKRGGQTLKTRQFELDDRKIRLQVSVKKNGKAKIQVKIPKK